MKARTCRRTASSRGSNQSPPTNGDGDVAAADVASVMAWVPSRWCRSEPTPPQPFPTNLAPRPRGPSGQADRAVVRGRGQGGPEGPALPPLVDQGPAAAGTLRRAVRVGLHLR